MREKDDIESLIYTLLFLINRKLSWGKSYPDIDALITFRMNLSVEEACDGIKGFEPILSYIINL
jgi:hypothetical protein